MWSTVFAGFEQKTQSGFVSRMVLRLRLYSASCRVHVMVGGVRVCRRCRLGSNRRSCGV
jgi:hypothetical protein